MASTTPARRFLSHLPFLSLLLFLAALSLPGNPAIAQDFYGEGNVLIAVDMGEFRQNGEVSYPEGTMGTLVWGDAAKEGESTRPAFTLRLREKTADALPVTPPEYELETVYAIGDTRFLPYYRAETPGATVSAATYTADDLPPELFTPSGEPKFLISSENVTEEDGQTAWWFNCEITPEGETFPCVDFLEIRCVVATEFCTVWEYTGIACSARPGFDPAYYGTAVSLTESEIRLFIDRADSACRYENQVYGDIRFEDYYGDRDGKAAYVILDGAGFLPVVGYYGSSNTLVFGFDCLVANLYYFPGHNSFSESQYNESTVFFTLAHELNHYITRGCTGHGDNSMWLGESLANLAASEAMQEGESTPIQGIETAILSSRLRMIPGFRWNGAYSFAYPAYYKTAYFLGHHFLRYIECQIGSAGDSSLWTDFIASQTPEGNLSDEELNTFLLNATGESLDAWFAQFMAAVVVGAEEGLYCMGDPETTQEYRPDANAFFRSPEEYGLYLGTIDERSAADAAIVRDCHDNKLTTALQGGGTTYAYRNDTGGRIEITGADDNWYFFAVTMDLPDPDRVIEISSAEELAMIGQAPEYPYSGNYALTADIDLQGDPDHPWIPLGGQTGPDTFTGRFDGRGYTISGLYVDGSVHQGLFGCAEGNAEIRNLTVCGTVSGTGNVGGIVGILNGGSIEDCTSRVTVQGNSTVGGIVGSLQFGSVSGCASLGSVTCMEFSGGGIAGSFTDSVISCCTGNAPVTGGESCGGIAGSGTRGTVTGCTASESVSGSASCGGIMGYADNITVDRCVNTAPVSVSEKSCGGIIGLANLSRAEHCRNLGAMSGDSCTAGICGNLNSSNLSECLNEGDVTARHNVGGIAGNIHGDCTVSNCCHTGTVSGVTRQTGALAADGFGGTVSIENCYSWQEELPAVSYRYEGTVTACYVRSETENGEGFLSAEAFADPESFPTWDFETVWTLDSGIRPTLRNLP